MSRQFWIIDTDTPGESRGQFSASGPYPTQKAAEAYIISDTQNLWDDSCPCLRSHNDGNPWRAKLHIVEVVRTVVPEIKATMKLIDAQ